MASKYIEMKNKELDRLMDADMNCDTITTAQAAKFLGMDRIKLSELACQGHVPFAIGGISQTSRYTKIPKLSFYNWVKQSAFAIAEGIEITSIYGEKK